MIIPENITNYNRTQSELEEFLLFSIMVAGKNAKQTAKKLQEFLFVATEMGTMTPLEWIEHLIHLEVNGYSKSSPLVNCMESHKLGQYNRLKSAFTGSLQYKNKLDSVSVEELEGISGIGPKTSRFFVLHSRPGIKHAVLDTHILAWLRDHGIKTPKSTPSKKKYLELEKKFLTLAEQYGITPAELDLQIWKSYSSKPKTRKKTK